MLSKEVLAAVEAHDQAMVTAERADRLKHSGHSAEAVDALKEALRLALKAASVLVPSKDEPTRAIVLRSTAWLAVETGEYRLAEKLAYEGLLGDPPGDIAAELRDVAKLSWSKLEAESMPSSKAPTSGRRVIAARKREIGIPVAQIEALCAAHYVRLKRGKAVRVMAGAHHEALT